MSNIQEPIQTEAEVLANTTAIPQEFYVTKNSLSVHITGIAPAGSITTGSVVSNKLKPGSVGFVATVPLNKKSDQRMITKIFSNSEVPGCRTFDFVALPKALQGNRPLQMGLRIGQSSGNANFAALEANPLLHNGEGATNLIPILVGPGSVSLAEPFSDEELKLAGFELAVDINWAGLLKGVAKAIPVIAETGLAIYKEVTGTSPGLSGRDKEEPEFILGALASIAKIAVPFISALI
tara:strand:- start:2278 stop:2988 length:711 start_codon:yes stop_codon:yes gene_type:complete